MTREETEQLQTDELLASNAHQHVHPRETISSGPSSSSSKVPDKERGSKRGYEQNVPFSCWPQQAPEPEEAEGSTMAVQDEEFKMQTFTHLGISWRSLSRGLLTFLEARIVERVALFRRKCGNRVGVAHATCAKSVRVDRFRWLR